MSYVSYISIFMNSLKSLEITLFVLRIIYTSWIYKDKKSCLQTRKYSEKKLKRYAK